MAHTANLIGDYIVVFGGYSTQSNQFVLPNLTILSLLGYSDYILPNPCTLKMVEERLMARCLERIKPKLEQV